MSSQQHGLATAMAKRLSNCRRADPAGAATDVSGLWLMAYC